MTRATLRLLALAWALGWACVSQATTVWVVASERSAGYTEASDALVADLEKGGLPRAEIRSVLAAELSGDEVNAANKGLFVTLGTEALKQLLQRAPRIPVIAALIPRGSYEHAIKDAERKVLAPTTALFLDQPFGRQLDLIRLVQPDAKRIGVLWGPESISRQALLLPSLQSHGMELVSGTALNGAVFAGLKTALEDADMFLAVADPQVFNSASLANILLATYRARIPMVAFSPAYTKAGALMAVYSTPGQIGMQAASMVRSVLQGGGLPASQYPLEFQVSVNEQVARSLGLQINADTLADRLRKVERKP